VLSSATFRWKQYASQQQKHGLATKHATTSRVAAVEEHRFRTISISYLFFF
jgi:hypothetical protein